MYPFSARTTTITPIANSLNFGISTCSLPDLMAYFRVRQDDITITGPIPQQLAAFCHVCKADRAFTIQERDGEVNWRESLRCEACDLINRWRSSLHLSEALCELSDESRIYITETISPLYQILKARYPKTVGSEYLAGLQSGELTEIRGEDVLVQDVTALSFEKDSFDAILSFDVLEHVPDYKTAVKEFFRVLKPKRMLVLSAPFTFSELTEIRASIHADGSVEHHLPPDYHGDPISDEGVLCFQSFGMDLLRLLEDVGFINARVCGFSDRASAYLDRNILFVARKPGWFRRCLRKFSRLPWYRG